MVKNTVEFCYTCERNTNHQPFTSVLPVTLYKNTSTITLHATVLTTQCINCGNLSNEGDDPLEAIVPCKILLEKTGWQTWK